MKNDTQNNFRIFEIIMLAGTIIVLFILALLFFTEPITPEEFVPEVKLIENWNVADITNCSAGIFNPKISGIWAGPWDGNTDRTLAPDTSALYYEVFLPVLPSEQFGLAHFEIKGEYPESRFLSWNLYNEKFVIEGDSHLTDFEIIPDENSVNPFVEGYPLKNGETKFYTLIINDFNKLDSNTKGNILIGGSVASGNPVRNHSLMARYYDPKREEGKPPGLVEFPRVLFKFKDTDNIPSEIKNNACLLIDKNWYAKLGNVIKKEEKAEGRVNTFLGLAGTVKYPGYLPASYPRYNTPEWVYGGNMMCTMAYLFPSGVIKELLDVFSESFSGNTPQDFLDEGKCGTEYSRGAFNFDNRYIFSFVDPMRGETVMRLKRPTFAKFGTDMSNMTSDVRYWSMCVIQTENLFYTYACARDEQIVGDPNDSNYATFIFTKFEDKPIWACDASGVTGKINEPNCKYNWLPYVSPVHWIYLRTLVSNTDSNAYEFMPITFVLDKDPNDSNALATHMGPYYPKGEYCTFDSANTQIKSCTNTMRELGSIDTNTSVTKETIE